MVTWLLIVSVDMREPCLPQVESAIGHDVKRLEIWLISVWLVASTLSQGSSYCKSLRREQLIIVGRYQALQASCFRSCHDASLLTIVS